MVQKRIRKRQTTFADTTTHSFVYDGVGNLLSATDALDKTTTYTYEYDAMGNKIAEINVWMFVFGDECLGTYLKL